MPTFSASSRLLPLLLALGCSHPDPSLRPLGMGPLAIAERDAKVRQQSDTRLQRESRSPTEDTALVVAVTRPSNSALPSVDPDAGAQATNQTADAGAAPSETAAAPTVEAWLGLFRGSDVTRYLLEGQGERSYDDPKARIRVEKVSADSLRFVLIDSSTEQDLCSLQGNVKGLEAALPPGQRCFIEPDEDMTVSSRPGVARLAGEQLTMSLVLDTSLDLDDTHTEGRIEYEFSGKRQ